MEHLVYQLQRLTFHSRNVTQANPKSKCYSPAGNYMFKVKKRNARTRCETYFTPCSTISVVNFEQVNARCVRTINTRRKFRIIRGDHSHVRVSWTVSEMLREPDPQTVQLRNLFFSDICLHFTNTLSILSIFQYDFISETGSHVLFFRVFLFLRFLVFCIKVFAFYF